jgi:peptidoglycan/xylan/chitin deacetylase (PgdA/CDA1 family)
MLRVVRLSQESRPSIFARAARRLVGPITHVATAEPMAALTFDDGQHPVFTPWLLDVLARHRARATFFMVGAAARRWPELVAQVRDAGHVVGNRRYHHAPIALLDRHWRRREIRACQRVLEPWSPRLFRAPYGRVTVGVSVDAFLMGHQTVACSVDVGDWWDADADRMASELARRVVPGSVVLLHDDIVLPSHDRLPALTRMPHVNRRPMLNALDTALRKLGGRLGFVTIPELLGQGRAQRGGWSG